MKKIICVSLNGGLIQTNQYRGPSGQEYQFNRGCATEIQDEKDANHFLKCGNGKLFVEVGIVAGIGNALKDKLTGNKTPSTKITIYSKSKLLKMNKAEQTKLIKALCGGQHRVPENETGRIDLILKFQEELKNTKEEDKDQENKTTDDGEKEEDSSTTKTDYTEPELYALVKDEQIKLIRYYVSEELCPIPPLEKERVDLILKLQKDSKKESDEDKG